MDWLGLFVAPALWAQAVYASPFLETRRHGSSFLLALLAGCLMFAALQAVDDAFPPLFSAGCAAMAAMVVRLLWKGSADKPTRNV